MSELYTRYKDILTPAELGECVNTIQNGGWKFVGESLDKDFIRFFYMNLDGVDFFSKFFFEKIKKIIGEDFTLDTVYANGQVHGLCGSMHCDDYSENAYTFLFYVNPNWEVHWGGGTTLYLNPDKYETANFIPNSAILFKGNIPHVGLEPTRHCKDLRITVAFKLFKKEII